MRFQSENFGCMNNIRNSLQITPLFTFLFREKRLLVSTKQDVRKEKNIFRHISFAWRMEWIKEQLWAPNSLYNTWHAYILHGYKARNLVQYSKHFGVCMRVKLGKPKSGASIRKICKILIIHIQNRGSCKEWWYYYVHL